MYRELVRRNLIILAISLVAFFVVSLFVTNFVNRNNSQTQLLYLSEIIANKIPDTDSEQELRDTVNELCKDQNWFGVVICNSFGAIIISSHNDSGGEGALGRLSPNELARVDNINANDRIYISESIMYYVQRVNDDIIIRTSLIMSDNVNFILYSTFLLLVVLIVVLTSSIALTRKTSYTIAQAFDKISQNLRTIREGGYHDIELTHRYEEVEYAFQEINAVNKSLAAYMEKIVYERDKANFILGNIGEGIVIVGVSGVVYTVNNFARKIFETTEFAEGCHYTDIIQDAYCCNMIEKEIQFRNALCFDYIDSKSNKIYFVNINIFCADNNVSEEDLVAMVLYDVTNARREEQDKAEFIANASHELRTPITSIRGFSEMLLSGMVKDEDMQKQYINHIHQESIVMKDTIDEMLYLSKLNYSSKENMQMEDVELLELSQYVVDKHALFNSGSISLKCHGQSAIARVNRSFVEHMLSNLVSNAIKYNKEYGTVDVEVGSNQGKPYVKITDSGQGICDKDIKRLFERFYRVDNSRSRGTGGTGLGLTIVSKICSLHNATVLVDSILGEGSTFTVEFEEIK